ncbi:MAG: FAD-dependent oxidoreductase [Halolamina sp.]
MARIGVVGGGPAGLSAGLFLAKNGQEAVVYDTDDTAMQYAHLFNYLGIESMDGEAYVETAREQAADFGVERREAEVTSVQTAGNGFTVATDDDEAMYDYVVFATGQSRTLAADLGCETTDSGEIDVDRDGRTSVDGAYAAGWATRKQQIQAVISAGDGAAAALDILSAEVEEGFHDFDTPSDAE